MDFLGGEDYLYSSNIFIKKALKGQNDKTQGIALCRITTPVSALKGRDEFFPFALTGRQHGVYMYHTGRRAQRIVGRPVSIPFCLLGKLLR